MRQYQFEEDFIRGKRREEREPADGTRGGNTGEDRSHLVPEVLCCAPVVEADEIDANGGQKEDLDEDYQEDPLHHGRQPVELQLGHVPLHCPRREN